MKIYFSTPSNLSTKEVNDIISLITMIFSNPPKSREAWEYINDKINNIPNIDVQQHIRSILSIQPWAI